MQHYTGLNLQNRSFKRRNLALTDFSGADIRGCDFSRAQLSGADFSNVRAGLSSRQKIVFGFIVTSVVLIVSDTISRLVFGTVGEPPLNLNTPHVLVLYVLLNLTAIAAAISAFFHSVRLGTVMLVLAGILSGAIVGFAAGYFYPILALHWLEVAHNQHIPSSLVPLSEALGFLKTHQTRVAGYGAIAGGALSILLSRFHERSTYKIVVSVASCIACYGATFLWGSIAGTYFSVTNFSYSAIFGLITLIFLGLTTLCFFRIGYELKNAIGTSFYKADLTHAKFKFADLRNTDFSKSIGYFPPNLK